MGGRGWEVQVRLAVAGVSGESDREREKEADEEKEIGEKGDKDE